MKMDFYNMSAENIGEIIIAVATLAALVIKTFWGNK